MRSYSYTLFKVFAFFLSTTCDFIQGITIILFLFYNKKLYFNLVQYFFSLSIIYGQRISSKFYYNPRSLFARWSILQPRSLPEYLLTSLLHTNYETDRGKTTLTFCLRTTKLTKELLFISYGLRSRSRHHSDHPSQGGATRLVYIRDYSNCFLLTYFLWTTK